MNKFNKIIGKWSIDVMYGLGAQEDTIIVFLPNGTGWIEFSHYVLCELNTFHWMLDDKENLSIYGDKYYEAEYDWKKSEFNYTKISVEVNNELAGNGGYFIFNTNMAKRK